MKVAYFAKTIDQRGGGGRYAFNVINGTRARGHEVVVIKEVEDGGEGIAALHRGIRGLRNIFEIRRLIRSVDVVHALDVWPYLIHAYLAVLGTNKKLFVSGVGTYSVAPLETFLKKTLLRIIFPRVERVFAISEYVKNEMRKRINFDRISTIYMGFTPLPALSQEKRDFYKEKYFQLLNGKPLIITVGAIKHRKGQLDTVKAVAGLVSKYPDVLYLMVGTTHEHAYIALINKYAQEHDIKKNILIIGDADSDEALAYLYEASDLFVMNSNNGHGHFEGFGLAFLEAASFGKPVVGSSGCGIEDALEDGFNGYLAEQGDIEDIAKKIDAALENAKSLGRNSMEFVKKFSWADTVEKYLEFYRI